MRSGSVHLILGTALLSVMSMLVARNLEPGKQDAASRKRH
jgi:hypothetical protein